MSRSDSNPLLALTPNVLLKAYMCGIFPMAESADDEYLYWIEPDSRGVIPLDQVHISKRLRRTVKSDKFEIRINSDFDSVIENCAASKEGRRSTWINNPIRKTYREMFELGHCHTVETWHDGKMVGGLYGVCIKGAFFGESMFSIERDSSKVALIHLIGRLIHGGFHLLDTQFYSEHLSTFGAVEIPKMEFTLILEKAMETKSDFFKLSSSESGSNILEIVDGHQNSYSSAASYSHS